MAEDVLRWLSAYGPFAVFGALLIAGLGVPSPAALMAVAAGFLVRTGRGEPIPLFLAGLAGMTLGHFLMYLLARKGIGGFLRRAERKKIFAKARKAFDEHKFRAVFLSRWLVTAIGLPVNLLAGSEGYPTARFLGAAVAGNAVWLTLFGAAGYVLGGTGSLEEAAKWTGLALGIAGAIAVIVWWRSRQAEKAAA